MNDFLYFSNLLMCVPRKDTTPEVIRLGPPLSPYTTHKIFYIMEHPINKNSIF